MKIEVDALEAFPRHVDLVVDVRYRNLWRVKLAAVLIAAACRLLGARSIDLADAGDRRGGTDVPDR